MAKYTEPILKNLSNNGLRDMSMYYDAVRIELYIKPKMGIKVRKRILLLATNLAQLNEINRLLQWRGEPPEKITMLQDLWDDPIVAADYVHFSKSV